MKLLLLLCVQILFVSIDVSQAVPNVLNYFGVSEDEAPTARIIDMETGKKYNIATEKYTIESMSQLCQEVVDGTAQVNQHTRMYHWLLHKHGDTVRPPLDDWFCCLAEFSV